MENNLLPMVIPPQHNLTICPHPFLTERVHRFAPFGMSIQEIIDSLEGLPKECAMTVQVNGTPIRPEFWSMYYPPEESYIAIRVLPMGGGSGGDSNKGVRMLMTVAVIVASAVTYGALTGPGMTVYAAMAAAAVSMAGNLLISALCPPASGNLSERAGINLDGVVNSISNARNQANPFGPVPVLLGHHIIVPFYAARPYTEIVGNDQYLRLLFVPCYLPVTLNSFKIGETNLEDFEGVEIQVRSISTDDYPDIYANTIYEESVNVELLEANGWTQRTTQLETDEIIVDVMCPNGLCVFNENNVRVISYLEYELQYAVKDSEVWVDLWSVTETTGQTVPIIPYIQSGSGDTIFRVLINIFTREILVLQGTPGYVNDDFDISLSPSVPPVPQGFYSLAQIYVPRGSSSVTSGMITDERATIWDDTFIIDGANDFLVTATSPVSDSVDVATGSSSTTPKLSAKTSDVVRKSHRLKVPQGQYDVRLRRVTADSVDDRVFDDLVWGILRSVTYETPVTLDTVALIALRIKATDQLNGIIDTFNCIGISKCKDWDTDTSTWIERETVNPASLYRYVLQHPSNKRAVADAKIDLVKLQEWHEFCQPVSATVNAAAAVDKGGGKVGIPCTDHPFSTNETVYLAGSVNYNDVDYSGTLSYGRFIVDETSSTNEVVITATYVAETFPSTASLHAIGLQYSSLIDYQTSLSNILQQIAAAGMASPTYVDGKYSVVIDQAQSTPIQHFTPRNSWGFSGNRNYPRIPHALRVIFANVLRNWEIDERVVYSDGYTSENATLFEQLELPGTTNPELAFVLARYHLATLILRPEKYSFYTDVENLVATRGDLIRVTHDVPLWGVAAGRIKSVITTETHITGVVMDSVMTMAPAVDYGLRVRRADGSTLVMPITLNVGDQTTLMLVTPILIIDLVDQLGLFGILNAESVELLIFSIEPGEDLTAKITCIDYAPDVYTASAAAIGAHDSQITAPYNPVAQAGYPDIYQIRSDESVMFWGQDGALHTRIVITLQPAGGYLSSIAFTELSVKFYDSDGPWYPILLTGFMKEIAYADVKEGDIYLIRLRYILKNGDPTPWTDTVQHTIIGKTTAPAAPTGVTATAVIGGIRLDWTNPSVIDFYGTAIWRAEADSFPGGGANYGIIGSPGEVMSFTDRDVAYNTTYYYWLKSYDTSLNASAVTDSVTNGPAQVTEPDIADTLQSSNYVAGTSGWFIGFRGDNDGYAEFNDVTVRGELVAGEIHIPDKTTANSFHVDVLGNAWWGCNEADFATSIYNANAIISNTGAVLFKNGLMGGWWFDSNIIASAEITYDGEGDPVVGATNIIIDGTGKNIRSGEYVTGPSGDGFFLSADWLEVNNASIRGILRTVVFINNGVSGLGGSLMILPADVLTVDMTAADASTLTIGGDETFAVDDILRIKDSLNDEWMVVTNIASAPTYTVTRDSSGDYDPDDNPVWKKGASVVNYGASGEGAIYMTGSDDTAPYLAVFTHTGSPWSSIDVRVILGNLNGFYGYSSDVYGIALGDATQYLKYDPTAGLRISGTVNITSGTGIQNFTDGGFLAAPDGDGLYITSSYMGYYKSSVWTTYIANNGIFAFSGDANNYITWNGTSLVVKGTVNITSGSGIQNFTDGGFLASPTGSGLFISSAYMGYYTGGVWKTYIANNGTFAFAGDGNNYITWNGSSLTIKGAITATSGSFTGAVYASSGSFTGAVTATSGSFTGAIYASSGTISGSFTIGGTWTSSGGLTINSTTGGIYCNTTTGYGVQGVGTIAGARGYSASGWGVYGNSGSGLGVYGLGGSHGVYGEGVIGVYGTGSSAGMSANGGTYGITVYGSSYGVYSASAVNNYFAGSISIATLTIGSNVLYVNGTSYFTGKIAAAGGADPPYVLYDRNTRAALTSRILKEVPPGKLGGAAMFFNATTNQIEIFIPTMGEFRDLQNNILETVTPITESFEVEPVYILDSVSGEIHMFEDLAERNEYSLADGVRLDSSTGVFYDITGKEVKKDKAVKVKFKKLADEKAAEIAAFESSTL